MTEEPTGINWGAMILGMIAAHISDLFKWYSYNEATQTKKSWISKLPEQLPSGRIKLVLEIPPEDLVFYAEANSRTASELLLSAYQWKKKIQDNTDPGGYEDE